MTLFDRWICIDWSAASQPSTGPNSIWIADSEAQGTPESCRLDNPPTRHLALDLLTDRLTGRGNQRVLIGLDASFALPYPGARALGAALADWRVLWDLVEREVHDGHDNTNDRFAAAARLNLSGDATPGPFWGHPSAHSYPGLPPNRPPSLWDGEALAQYRIAEDAMRAVGHQVQSTWKIAYPGSVGGQFLMAVGWMRRLQAAVAPLAIWPFETGFGTTPRAGEVWIGELWPGEFTLEQCWDVRDADQVWSTARAVRAADEAGALAGWFEGPSDPAHRKMALEVEGWPWSPSLLRTEITSD